MTKEELTQVVTENRPKLVRYAQVELRRCNLHAQDAEDMVQQAMVDMVKTYDRINLDGSASIFTIMCQKVLDEVNSHARKAFRREDLAPHQPLTDNDEDTHRIGEFAMPTIELAVDVHAALDALPAEQARLVKAVTLGGWSYQEVGRNLGLTKNQAQWRYERGCTSLRDALAVYAPANWDPTQARAA